MPDSHGRFMQVALQEAYRGIEKGEGGPFGACVVRKGEIIARGHNEVLKTRDPSRHAEVCAIGRASRLLGSPHLQGSVIYSTTEPCVMCFAAIHWACVRKIYFGTRIRDARRLGFNELVISNRTLRRLGKSRVEIVSGVLGGECRELLSYWKALGLPLY